MISDIRYQINDLRFNIGNLPAVEKAQDSVLRGLPVIDNGFV
jgi:hypothetical protein